MTVETLVTHTDWYTADGVQVNWTYAFSLFSQTDVRVDVRDDTTGDIVTYDSNLTLFDTDDTSGYVKYPATGAAVAAGYSVRVRREVPYTQEVEIGNEGRFNAEMHERAFDRATLQAQQLAHKLTQIPTFGDGEVGGTIEAGTEDDLVAYGPSNGFKSSGYTLTELAADLAAVNTGVATIAGSVAAAEADALATAADRVQTGLDAAATAADVLTVAADKAIVAADKATVAADKATVAADKATVAADKGIVLGYRDEVEADRIDVQADKVIASAAADAAVAAQAAAEAALASTLTAYDNFDDRYLGSKTSDPTLDNDGNALAAGSLYFNSVDGVMKVYTGSAWVAAYVSGGGYAVLANNGSDYNAATFRTNLDLYSTAETLALPFGRMAKTTLVDADTFSMTDSAASNVWKKITWANIKTALNALYQPLAAALTSWASVSRAANFDAFATTPSSANLRALLTDEVGTGAAYFVGGALGTPASATLTNATGLPIAGLVASTTQAIGVGSVELGHASDTTLARSAAGVMTIEGVEVVTLSRTQTLTNKTLTPRIGTTTSSATPTPSADSHDQYNVTALAEAATFGAPTGTPTDGQKLILRVKDNGTARALAWNAIYRAMGTALPTTTVLNKTLYLGLIYNAADTKWDLVASAQEA